jgi:TRAP-type C4-dicarboxylate transport system permease small subunit
MLFVPAYLFGKHVLESGMNKTEKTFKLGAVAIMLFTGVLLLSGIIFWLKTGNIGYIIFLIPFAICLIPLILPFAVAGLLIQSNYRKILQGYLDKYIKHS